MANKTITQLPDATTPYDGTEEFAMWQGGATVKGTLPVSSSPAIANLRDYGVTDTSDAGHNSRQIAQAMEDVGYAGTVVVPNFGVGKYVNHRGITVASGVTLAGENERGNYNVSAYIFGSGGASLKCVDSTVPNILFDGLPSAGGYVRDVHLINLSLYGGFDCIAIVGGVQNTISVVNCSASGPQRASLFIGSVFLEETVFQNLMLKGNNSTTHGVYISGVYGQTYLADVEFTHIWALSNGGFGFLVDNPKTDNIAPNWTSVRINWLRINNCRYGAAAFRGYFNTLDINNMTCEQTCTVLAANASIDYLFDGTAYGSGGNLGGANVTIRQSAPENTGYIPLLGRLLSPHIDNNGPIGFGGSLGHRWLDRREFFIGAGDTNSTLPTDPGVSAYGALNASVMPVWDLYPMASSIRSSSDAAANVEGDVLPGMCTPNCFAMNDYESESYVNAMV